MKRRRIFVMSALVVTGLAAIYVWLGLRATTPQRDEAALAAGAKPAVFPGARGIRSAFVRMRHEAPVREAVAGYAPGISGVEEEKAIGRFLDSWADEDLAGVCGWIASNMKGKVPNGWTAAAVERVGERYPRLALAEGLEVFRAKGVAGIRPDVLFPIAARLDAGAMVSVLEAVAGRGTEREHAVDYGRGFDFGEVARGCLAASDPGAWLDLLPGNFIGEWTGREPWKAQDFQKERVRRGLMKPGDNGIAELLSEFVYWVPEDEAEVLFSDWLAQSVPGFEPAEMGWALSYDDVALEVLERSLRRLPHERREEIATALLRDVKYLDGRRVRALRLFPSAEARLRGVKAVGAPDQRVFLKLDAELRALGHGEQEIEQALTEPAR